MDGFLLQIFLVYVTFITYSNHFPDPKLEEVRLPGRLFIVSGGVRGLDSKVINKIIEKRGRGGKEEERREKEGYLPTFVKSLKLSEGRKSDFNTGRTLK